MADTYSFQDVSVVIAHPSFGQYSTLGEGVGNITVAMTNDVSIHDVAADGKVMTSKIKARNGSVVISVQQVSSLHNWLTRLYNYLEASDPSEWEKTTITVRAPLLKQTTICSRCSFQKLPDKVYQQQGQMVGWSILSADIQQNAF